MTTQIKNLEELTEPIIRRKALSARNEAGMMTVVDTGEYGLLVTDEPEAHGGSG